MTRPQKQSLNPPLAANYNSAIARAVEWLGDRYLLAKPINAAAIGGSRRYSPPEISSGRPLDR
jgi:hypothetical protein